MPKRTPSFPRSPSTWRYVTMVNFFKGRDSWSGRTMSRHRVEHNYSHFGLRM